MPAAAVDPRSGEIYVAWSDNRFRDDVVNDIVVVASDDGGLTWTAPGKVNPGKTDDYLEHFTPALDVGPDGSEGGSGVPAGGAPPAHVGRGRRPRRQRPA